MLLPISRLKRNIKQRQSYLEPPVPKLPRKPKKPRAYNVPLQPPFKTHLYLQKTQGLNLKCEDENEFYPLIIRNFQVEDRKKYIFCDISKLDGFAKNVAVFKNNILSEFWSSAIIGYGEDLVRIGWTTRGELKSHEIEDGDGYNVVSWRDRNKTWYQKPLIYCNHKKQCKCNKYRACIPGKVINIDYNKYYGQLSPEYEFRQSKNIQGVNGNGWIHYQISDDDKFKHKNIVLYNIRRYKNKARNIGNLIY